MDETTPNNMQQAGCANKYLTMFSVLPNFSSAGKGLFMASKVKNMGQSHNFLGWGREGGRVVDCGTWALSHWEI